MAGKTLFLKFNTGPSGHGMAPAAGEALALKLAGAEDVKVFVVEGEGGLTPGAFHETKNDRLGSRPFEPRLPRRLERLRDRSTPALECGGRDAGGLVRSRRVAGCRHRARIGVGARHSNGARRGCGANPDKVPSIGWFKTQKGRGYGKVDAASHGSPWPPQQGVLGERREFMDRYGVEYVGVDEPAPADPRRRAEETPTQVAMNVLVVTRVVTWFRSPGASRERG